MHTSPVLAPITNRDHKDRDPLDVRKDGIKARTGWSGGRDVNRWRGKYVFFLSLTQVLRGTQLNTSRSAIS
jgi:hypothetical protein